jgi:hypothetical protein
VLWQDGELKLPCLNPGGKAEMENDRQQGFNVKRLIVPRSMPCLLRSLSWKRQFPEAQVFMKSGLEADS